MVEGVLQFGVLHGEQGVAAPHHRERVRSRHGGGDAPRAGAERLQFEHAHRAVPQDRLRVGDDLGVGRHGLGSDVETHEATRDLGGGHGARLRVGGDRLGRHHVPRHLDQDAPRGGARARGAHLVEAIPLHQALAHVATVGGDQREGHRAADEECVDAVEQGLNHAELVRHLCTAQDRHVGTIGVMQETG